jgi:hypothetical protein
VLSSTFCLSPPPHLLPSLSSTLLSPLLFTYHSASTKSMSQTVKRLSLPKVYRKSIAVLFTTPTPAVERTQPPMQGALYRPALSIERLQCEAHCLTPICVVFVSMELLRLHDSVPMQSADFQQLYRVDVNFRHFVNFPSSPGKLRFYRFKRYFSQAKNIGALP